MDFNCLIRIVSLAFSPVPGNTASNPWSPQDPRSTVQHPGNAASYPESASPFV